MSRVKISEDNIFTLVANSNFVLLAILTAAALIGFSFKVASSVCIGGILAIANFYWLAATIRKTLDLPAAKAGRFAYSRYLLRLAILAVVLWLLITRTHISIFGLLIGLSITVINIIVFALYRFFTVKGG